MRISLIDIAKGISIIMVAFTHTELRHIYHEFNDNMALFRLPLFFFLSGIFFKYTDNFKFFLTKKSDALLKPYFFTLGTLLMFSFVLRGGSFGRQLFGILYGNGDTIRWIPLWFLTHLWLIFLFMFFLFRLFNLQKRSFFF